MQKLKVCYSLYGAKILQILVVRIQNLILAVTIQMSNTGNSFQFPDDLPFNYHGGHKIIFPPHKWILVMINSTTGRMTTEHWKNYFVHYLSYGLGIMLEKVGGIKKVGVADGVHFPWEIIFLMTS